ncbi:MAG: hypothetical protein ACYC09_13865 [Bacteroidota bacterium]
MLTKNNHIKTLLIIGLVLLSNCSNNSKNDNSTLQKDSSNVVQHYQDTRSTNRLNYLSNVTEDLFIGVISSNDLLFPFAQMNSDSDCLNPWTEMWIYDDHYELNRSVPKEWYFYPHDNNSAYGSKIIAYDTQVAEFACLFNWVINTSKDVSASTELQSFAPHVGFAFNHPVIVLSDSAIVANQNRFSEIKKSLGLMDNDVDGESRIKYTDKLYFHWNQSIIGIIDVVGYESESLLIIQIDNKRVRKLLEVGLGGC